MKKHFNDPKALEHSWQLAWLAAAGAAALGLLGVPQAEAQPHETPLVGIAYQTGFEASEGFLTANDLVGQQYWTGLGTGGNGVVTVSNAFGVQGQEAYVGYAAPISDLEEELRVWYPLNLTTIAADRPLRFTVRMDIEDSINRHYDGFAWRCYNTLGSELFEIHFANDDFSVWVRSGTDQWLDTGKSFTNGVMYELSVLMDFGAKRWSASLGDLLLATNQPLGSPGLRLDVGHIDAAWIIYDPALPGDNYMVFDDYRVVWEPDMPRITSQPRSQEAAAGSSVSLTAGGGGAAKSYYHWYFQGAPLAQATGTNFTIPSLQPANLGDYTLVVTNAYGAATSAVATLTLQTPVMGVAYRTGFEPEDGFLPDGTVAGQAGWRGQGSGGNGIVNNFIPGLGHQAFLGFGLPDGAEDDTVLARYPLHLTHIPAGRPLRFSATMGIMDSSNGRYDAFQWQIYNSDGESLLTFNFDNNDFSIWYLAGSNAWANSRQQFATDQIYQLTVTLDFGKNRWSASLDDSPLATDQLLASPGQRLDWSDIGAAWLINDPGNPGDNYLFFDNVQVVWMSDVPGISIQAVDGKPSLKLSGTPGTVVQIEGSSQLTEGASWQVLHELTLTGASQTWADEPGAAGSCRFYRAVLK